MLEKLFQITIFELDNLNSNEQNFSTNLIQGTESVGETNFLQSQTPKTQQPPTPSNPENTQTFINPFQDYFIIIKSLKIIISFRLNPTIRCTFYSPNTLN